MVPSVAQTFAITFPVPFSTVPQFTVLPIRWTFTATGDPATYIQSIQTDFSSLTKTGVTVTLGVDKVTDQFHLNWAASVGPYLQLFNFRMTQNQFNGITDDIAVPKQAIFDSSQLVFDAGAQVIVTTQMSGYSRVFSNDPINPGHGLSRIQVAPKFSDGALNFFLDVAASELFGPTSDFVFQTTPTYFNFGVKAFKLTFLSFTLFIARKPATGEKAYMSMAYADMTLTRQTIGDQAQALTQLTATPLDRTKSFFVPIIGFTGYDVQDMVTADYVSQFGPVLIDQDTFSWTMDVNYDGEIVYFFTFFAVPCPGGCVDCTSPPQACTACYQNQFRVATPNPLCPCLAGFYEDANQICQPCPASRYCLTCDLVSGSVNPGGIDCLSCSCAQHREITSGDCTCKPGYQEDGSHPNAPYCVKIAV